jgi:4-amino-4-deoxy-L-arabinose transferase-like glycosyltransferase
MMTMNGIGGKTGLSSFLGRLEDPSAMARAEIAVLCTAFALRLAWSILVPMQPVSDGGAYDVFARNIVSSGTYGWKAGEPSAYWPVGTSAIYAAIYFIFGFHYAPLTALNIAIGVASIFFAMELAKRWSGNGTAFFAGGLMAIWPLLVEYSTIMASELHFNAFILASFWVVGLKRPAGAVRCVVVGVLLAMACYIRPIGLLVLPLLFVPRLANDRRFGRYLASCVLAAVAMIAVILPWAYRNYAVFGKVVLISTNGGVNLWMGNNPGSNGEYMEPPVLVGNREPERDKELKVAAVSYIKLDPLRFVGRSFAKLLKLHDRETIGVSWNEGGLQRVGLDGASRALKALSSGYWYAVLILGLIGICLKLIRDGASAAIAYIPIVLWIYFAAVHSVTVVGDRYHMPSIPFIAILAGYAVCAIVSGRDAAGKPPAER